MKIPTKGRYAVSAMLDLALHDSIGPLTIADISEKQNISLSYLEQIFSVLRKNGLVRGTRGPGGGYRLAESADRITIAQVIHAVDNGTSAGGARTDEYLPYELWVELSKRIYRFLDGITLAHCISSLEAREQVESHLLTSDELGDASATKSFAA